MILGLRAHRLIVPMIAGLLTVAWTMLPTAAHAQSDERPELSIRPAGQSEASFFDLEAAPGEELALEVELENTGNDPIRARSYAADAYTIVNGGFGIRLFGEADTGPTLWLEYRDKIIDLAPGEVVTRKLTLRVPADAGPGQHIAGLAVENAEPIRGSGEVALDQVVRKAIAVLVTVPGPIEPSLEIGTADHLYVAERSVVGIDLRNTGNVLLRPTGTVAVSDDSGEGVAKSSVAMDSFYGGTETRLEIPLAERLPPGRYTVSVALADAERDIDVSGADIAFTIEAEGQPSSERSASEAVRNAVRDLISDDASRFPFLVGLIGLLVLLLLIVTIRRRFRRPIGRHSAKRRGQGRRRRHAQQGDDDAEGI